MAKKKKGKELEQYEYFGEKDFCVIIIPDGNDMEKKAHASVWTGYDNEHQAWSDPFLIGFKNMASYSNFEKLLKMMDDKVHEAYELGLEEGR